MKGFCTTHQALGSSLPSLPPANQKHKHKHKHKQEEIANEKSKRIFPARILDRCPQTRVLDLSLRPELLLPTSTSDSQQQQLEEEEKERGKGEKIRGRVELVKQHYLVVSLPPSREQEEEREKEEDHKEKKKGKKKRQHTRIGYVAVRDYNTQLCSILSLSLPPSLPPSFVFLLTSS